MTTTRIPVGGMTCAHCTSSVTEALTEIPGVASVTVSLDNAEAVVEHSSEFDAAAAHDAIREVGYSVGP